MDMDILVISIVYHYITPRTGYPNLTWDTWSSNLSNLSPPDFTIFWPPPYAICVEQEKKGIILLFRAASKSGAVFLIRSADTEVTTAYVPRLVPYHVYEKNETDAHAHKSNVLRSQD